MKATPCSLDIINNLPQNIIETILCHAPIKDAVRTSILSKKWRYNWVNIPMLVFNQNDMFGVPLFGVPSNKREWMANRCKFFCAIYQVLLLHRGPILEFTLRTTTYNNCGEIDQIIVHLSRHNTVKKFSLELYICVAEDGFYKLPLSVFSLHELTDLHLRCCDLVDYQRTFSGFGNLTSLTMEKVKVTTKTLLHLISKSPLLKSFTVKTAGFFCFFKNNNPTFTELFVLLPVIEYLSIPSSFIMCLAHDAVPRELPQSLVHLKYFCLEKMFIEHGLPFLSCLIRCSPNLEKIKLMLFEDQSPIEPEIDFVIYSDIWLEHLNELEIEDFSNTKPQLDFLKFMLAKSPVLKMVKISPKCYVGKDEELVMLRTLLRIPCASPMAYIFVHQLFHDWNDEFDSD